MDNFESTFEERLDNCKTKEDVELLKDKAKAYETYCKAKKHRSKARSKKSNNKLSRKDIFKITAVAIPGVMSLAVAIVGYKQAKYCASVNYMAAKDATSARLKMVDTLTNYNKNEIIVDKPIKVVNDICK